jgi:hypothetical protein
MHVPPFGTPPISPMSIMVLTREVRSCARQAVCGSFVGCRAMFVFRAAVLGYISGACLRISVARRRFDFAAAVRCLRIFLCVRSCLRRAR